MNKKILSILIVLLSLTTSIFCHGIEDSRIIDYEGREEHVLPSSWVFFTSVNNPSLASPYLENIGTRQYFVLSKKGNNLEELEREVNVNNPVPSLSKSMTKRILQTQAFKDEKKLKTQLLDSFATILKDVNIEDTSWVKIETSDDEIYEFVVLISMDKRTFKKGYETLLLNVFRDDSEKDHQLKKILRENVIFCPIIEE